MNYNIFLYFYTLAQDSIFLRHIAVFISGPVSYIIFPALVLLLFLYKAKSQYMNLFSLFFVTTFFAWFFARLLKEVFKIPRPFVTHPQIIPFTNPGGFSFPSEHASVYGALVVLLFFIDIRAGIIGSLVALFVLISRMVVGVHYPLDVLVGLLLGISIALYMVFLSRKYITSF
jgi:undecaprenyl-diphosphatase